MDQNTTETWYLWHTEERGRPLHSMDYTSPWLRGIPVYARTEEEAKKQLTRDQRLVLLPDGGYDRKETVEPGPRFRPR